MKCLQSTRMLNRYDRLCHPYSLSDPAKRPPESITRLDDELFARTQNREVEVREVRLPGCHARMLRAGSSPSGDVLGLWPQHTLKQGIRFARRIVLHVGQHMGVDPHHRGHRITDPLGDNLHGHTGP